MSKEPTGTAAERPVLLTPAAVAAMLSVHRETVYAMCAAGDLRSVVLEIGGKGRRRRIFADSVDAYIARQTGGAVPA